MDLEPPTCSSVTCWHLDHMEKVSQANKRYNQVKKVWKDLKDRMIETYASCLLERLKEKFICYRKSSSWCTLLCIIWFSAREGLNLPKKERDALDPSDLDPNNSINKVQCFFVLFASTRPQHQCDTFVSTF